MSAREQVTPQGPISTVDDSSNEAQAENFLEIDVCFTTPGGSIWYKTCQLPQGACITDAIRASKFEQDHPTVDWVMAGVGLFGVRCEPNTVLRDHDRVEIYRPLVFDPKESRRRRAQHRREKLRRGEVPNGRAKGR